MERRPAASFLLQVHHCTSRRCLPCGVVLGVVVASIRLGLVLRLQELHLGRLLFDVDHVIGAYAEVGDVGTLAGLAGFQSFTSFLEAT